MDGSVAPSNTAQETAWDGNEGSRWAEHADLLEGMPARYDAALLDAAAVEAGSRVLDVGCGTGSVTRAAARRAGHSVSVIEYHAVSRLWPLTTMCWRKVPS